MKSLEQYIKESLENEALIQERFRNAFDKEEMMKYSKEAWDIISKAYAYIDGVAGCPDYESFVKEYIDNAEKDKLMWKMVTREGKLKCIKIYTMKRGGRKGIIMASDGTEQGKKDLMKILDEDYRMKDRQAWNEVSGKALGSALKAGGIPLPNWVILELMPDKSNNIELREDGWFYTRIIGGKKHTKLLMGITPKGSGEQISDEEKQKIKELSMKYEKEDEKLN